MSELEKLIEKTKQEILIIKLRIAFCEGKLEGLRFWSGL